MIATIRIISQISTSVSFSEGVPATANSAFIGVDSGCGFKVDKAQPTFLHYLLPFVLFQ